MTTEIDQTRHTLRCAADLMLRVQASPPTPEQEAELERLAYELHRIARAADDFAREREEWTDRNAEQAHQIANLRADLDQLETQDAEIIAEMRAELMHLRERVVYLAAATQRAEAILDTTRDHLQSALRQRDAAREARATDAAIRKAGAR